MSHQIEIYVADLAAYNNAILHSVWINATLPVEDMWEQIRAMLDKSPVENAEEYAVHDHSSFECAPVSGWESPKSIHTLANFIEKYDALGARLSNHFSDVDEATKAAEEQYHGRYSSVAVADYSEQITEESSDIPQHLHYYIDCERMARDWERGYWGFAVQNRQKSLKTPPSMAF